MTAHDWAGLVMCFVGGGAVGWGLFWAREHWRERPMVIWDATTGRWRSARSRGRW